MDHYLFICFTGLLKMVVEVFFENVVEDITFVPISINYDRLIEDVLFVREVLGIPKPKESTTVRCVAYELTY